MALDGVAWISGAGHGIGRAIAIKFAQEGCKKLTIVDINQKLLEETSELVKQEAKDISLDEQVCDLSNASQVSQCLSRAIATWGSIDYAVNVAGVMGPRLPSCEMSLETWDSVLDLNLRGTWMCSKLLLQQMLKQTPKSSGQRGAIVNIASLMGVLSMDGPPNYVASKHGVIGLTKADAEAYGPYGIRVNSICPGLIDSDFSNRMPVQEIAPFMEPLVKRTPLRRPGRPQEIADACVFLVSEKASFITGSNLIVDGGFSIT